MTTWTNLKTFEANQVMANFEAFQKMSDCFAKWEALPQWIKTAPQLIMIMQAGVDLWLSVTEAMQSLSIINGRVTMYGAKIIERVREAWYDIKLDEKVEYQRYQEGWKTLERLDWYCKATLIAPDWKSEWTDEFTITEARNIWLMKKDNWLNYPKLMLRYRAIWQAVKFFCPQVLWSIWMYEEMKDFAEDEVKAKRNSSFERIDNVDDILEWFETNVRSSDATDEESSIVELQEVVAEAIIQDAIEDEVITQEEVEEQKEEVPEVKEESEVIKSAKESLELWKSKKAQELKKEAAEGEEPKSNVIEVWSRVSNKLMWEWYVKDMFWTQLLVKFDNDKIWLKKINIDIVELVK